MSIKIAPSILSADFGSLAEDVKMINNSQADLIHVDVMDGVFVPNISFGFPVINAVKKIAEKPLDVHLMIVQPEKYIKQFVDVGADILTFHYEATDHAHRMLHAIKEFGIKAGIAINPHTPVSLLSEVISELDQVILMSVNPGFGGQKFIPNTINKLIELKKLIHAKNSQAMIEIDGGVNKDNAGQLKEAGADILVAGSFVFSSKKPEETIEELKS